MKILNIEELQDQLTEEQSFENLQSLKAQVRHSWEHGNEVTEDKFLSIYPLIDEHLKIYQNWFNLYGNSSFILSSIDSEANEVVIHDYQNISILKNSYREYHPISNLDKDDYEISIELFARAHSQNFNYSHPFVSFTINHHKIPLRITLTHKSITPKKSHKVFIRIMASSDFALSSFCSPASFLINAIKLKKNILIAGSTGSGKTSFMKSLLASIDSNDHIIVIEDTHELKSTSQNYTHLLARDQLSLDDLLTYSLRMTPDRLIVGEVRSSEVITALLALNTGHKGFMTSIHANSALDSIHRICLLFNLYSKGHPIEYEDILALVVKNIDMIIYLDDKKVVQVLEPQSSEGKNIYYSEVSLE